jgi:hypothetical protein
MDYRARMIEELDKLHLRVTKLHDAIDSDRDLDLGQDEESDMEEQLQAMLQYRHVLARRLARAFEDFKELDA